MSAVNIWMLSNAFALWTLSNTSLDASRHF